MPKLSPQTIELKDHKNLTFQEVCDLYGVTYVTIWRSLYTKGLSNPIISLLKSTQEEMSPKDISAILGTSAGCVRTTLRRLVEKKIIKQSGYGKYSI